MGALIPERLLLSFSLLLFFSCYFSFSSSISFSFLVHTFAAFRGTSLRSLFQENRGLSGHFASLVVSRTSAAQRRFAAYRGTSLRSCFQKKGFRTPLFLFSPFPPFFFFFFFFLFFFFFFFSFSFSFSFSLSKKSACYLWGFLFFFKKVPASNRDFDFFFINVARVYVILTTTINLASVSV